MSTGTPVAQSKYAPGFVLSLYRLPGNGQVSASSHTHTRLQQSLKVWLLRPHFSHVQSHITTYYIPSPYIYIGELKTNISILG